MRLTPIGWSRGTVGIVALCVAWMFSAGPSRAEYRLAPGDIVEIVVAGFPDLRQRTPVQLDGTISMPMLGGIPAAESTTAELQARVELGLAGKILRQRMPDGRERIALIQPGDVSAAVVEYRPVYVTGDVLTPGQHAFRPNMTARHAIALSGGPSKVRGRVAAAGVETVDAVRDYRTVATALAKEQILAWRLAAELDGTGILKEQPLADLIPTRLQAEFVDVEKNYLKTRATDLENEKAFLRSMVRQSGEQIATLTTQEEQEERGLKADIEELDRVNKLFSAGNVTSPRVTETRRAVLLSSTRRLQTAANLTQVKQQRDELSWRLDRLEVQRMLDLLRETKESQLRLAELRARLESASDKLQVLGGLAVNEAGPEARPEIAILRKSADRWDRIPAVEDADLQPGDTIEVVFRSANPAAALTRPSQ